MDNGEIPENANEHCPGTQSEAAGKSDSCAGCPNQETCATGPKGPDPGHESYKSNFGWSPVYVNDNLGVMSTDFLNPNSDDPMIWRGPRKNALIKQFLKEVYWGDIDFLVVDTPPGTSDEQITIVQCLVKTGIDGAIILTTPQQVSIADVRKGLNFCKKVKVPLLGVVENMSGLEKPLRDIEFKKLMKDTDTSVDATQDTVAYIRENAPKLLDDISVFIPVFDSSGGGAERMCQEMGVPFLGRVPLDPQLCRAAELGKSCFEGNKCSASARALKNIIQKVVDSIKMNESLSGGEKKETP